MSDVIFCRTRHHYDSYTDYWALVELSGYPIIFVDEIPREGVRDKTFIATPMNGEWDKGIETDGRVVLHDLEYRREPYPPPPGVREVFHMDKQQAECIGAKYVPVGGHPDLRLPYTVFQQEPYDAAYLGYMIPRRQQIAHDLDQRGIRRSPTGAWGMERHSVLMNSRSYVHVHQWDDIAAVPALRLVVAAAYHLPYITEQVADPGIFPPTVWFSSAYEHLAQFAAMWLKDGTDGGRFKDTGERLHQFLAVENTFRRTIENAL